MRRLPLLLLAAAQAATAPAQVEAPAPARPRVGLVLGGGGARGAAHVGVLQVLEELRVPVDVVVGTSMGSIVGGLYASGYSPGELERILRDARWSELLADDPPRTDLWFRRRQDERRFQVRLELGWKDGGPVLPPGLILGLQIERFLDELLLPVAAVDDFDELPLPFRCVAADVADGSPYVFEEGSLARAIRASMSIPGVFAPVELDGRVLVDGGIVDNVPVDVARALGAEVVIVVDVSTPLADATELGSFLGVSQQVIGILTSVNCARSMESLGDADVGLSPALGDLGPLDFERAGEAVAGGRTAAEAAAARLGALAVDEPTWRAWLVRQRRQEAPAPVLRRLTIDSDAELSASILRARAGLRPGQPLDAAALRAASNRLAGLGIFERVGFDVSEPPEEPGTVDAALRPVAKRWGPHFLRLGLGVTSDMRGGGEFDLGVQHTWVPLDRLGGEWRNEVQVGSRTRLFTELHQPLDPSLRWYVAPSIEYQQNDLDLFLGERAFATVDAEAVELAMTLGRYLGDWGELRGAVGHIEGRVRPQVATPGLLPARFDVSGGLVEAALRVDTLDDIRFPRQGVVADVEWRLDDQADDPGAGHQRLSLALGAAASRGDLTVLPQLEAGKTVDGRSAVSEGFALGGFRRLSGLSDRALRGDEYALGVLEFRRRLAERTTRLGMASYLGVTLEAGGIRNSLDPGAADDLVVGGAVYFAVDSLLGPTYLSLGLAEGGETALNLFVGASF